MSAPTCTADFASLDFDFGVATLPVESGGVSHSGAGSVATLLMHQRVLSQMALRPSFMLGLLFSGAGGATVHPGLTPPCFPPDDTARKS